ncbi:methyltransferase domain-containing protein [Actinocrispum sp. NPDC049592]|uniref:methyltransferase domain-containing protein n=1 Tax=Actinocrispum sp. NPDC049592 TaxID=3154835 RepID=UPI00341B4D51
MLITSRSAAEYTAMFDLPDLSGVPVLDCCAGASSFAAESAGEVVACDPGYRNGYASLADEVEAGLRGVEGIIDDHRDDFVWSWYGDRDRRIELRRTAARLFLDDVRDNANRYVAGALPCLPFANKSFDVALCSHLLFTWSDVFDEDWHRRALAELVRVARREVRVFPLVVQGTGAPVPFLPRLLDELGPAAEVVKVPFCFQRGADEMLRISIAPIG